MFEEIISAENLLAAWEEFVAGKRGKPDVQEFQLRLMDNILALRDDLRNGTYRHGEYQAFNISDPKPRNIHKAAVRDRLLHHAIYRVLYPFRAKQYIRYADDFVIFSSNRDWLTIILPEMYYFLQNRLKLQIHPDKLFIKTLASGVDFLGWVHFPDHRVLRTATKRRMVRRVAENPSRQVIDSYRGMLSHGNAYNQILNFH